MEGLVMDCRIQLLEEYCESSAECRELLQTWNQNNMLFNSLRFYQVYNGDVESSALISPLIKGDGSKNDIMTSWWKPTKWFLFRTRNGKREELTKRLLAEIPREADTKKLRDSLSKLRYRNNKDKIDIAVIEAFMDFLKAIYYLGNMTSSARAITGGALDNWDAKLSNIRSNCTEEEWIQYVEQNEFQDYFRDNTYPEVITFWNYGPSKLSEASDDDWKEYFINVKERIEQRNKRLSNLN